jgi:hypothetical protein
MSPIEQRVLEALAQAPGASSWESLLAIYRADREAFYLLACDGVSADATPRLVELADLARRVRDAVRGTYQIEFSDDGAHLVGPHVDRTFIPANLVEQVDTFLRAVDGKGIQDRPGRDYEGTAVREAQVRFQLGDPATWEDEASALQTRLDAQPIVLRLDPHDFGHLATQPAYITFALGECARSTVLAPTYVFQDLERGEGCQDNLRGGWAFCGKPRWAVDNTGRPVKPPDGMVFVVYADRDGYVFDWDWVEESAHEPGCPVDSHARFGNLVPLHGDAYLELPGELPTPRFNWTEPSYSVRGDCIFCYITDEVSYACRINRDLTVFRSLRDPNTVTGFKVKNVRRILEDDRDIVFDDDPDLIVSVQSALLATLKGHRDAHVSVYEVFIAAFKKASDPPKVRVPKRQARQKALATS